MHSIACDIRAKVLKQVIFFPTDFVAFLDQKFWTCWENFRKFCFPSEILTNFAEFRGNFPKFFAMKK
jgi:hypothetical protein